MEGRVELPNDAAIETDGVIYVERLLGEARSLAGGKLRETEFAALGGGRVLASSCDSPVRTRSCATGMRASNSPKCRLRRRCTGLQASAIRAVEVECTNAPVRSVYVKRCRVPIQSSDRREIMFVGTWPGRGTLLLGAVVKAEEGKRPGGFTAGEPGAVGCDRSRGAEVKLLAVGSSGEGLGEDDARTEAIGGGQRRQG